PRTYVTHLDGTSQTMSGWPILIATQTGASFTVRHPTSATVLVSREDTRASNFGMYGTRLQFDGTVSAGWPAPGYPFFEDANPHAEYSVSPDGQGGAFLTWVDG